MKKYILRFSILALVVAFSIILIHSASAQSSDTSSDALSKLTYPITELGNCKDRADCKIYCDDSANTAACVSYAEKKSLLSQEDLQIAKKFVATGAKGPGGCNGKKECQAYCDDKTHIDECVSYAEKNGLMSAQDLQKAKKVQAAVKKGVKFPACKNKKECDTYCEDSIHMEECITFAQEAGLLSDQELQNTQKVLTAIKQGVKLPPCKGKEACDIYCAQESHTDECTNFAVAAGLVTSDEAKIIKETGGKGPGGCKNKKDCDSYCSNTANREFCLNFAQEHNLLSQEQLDQIKQGGPGGGEGPGNGAGQGNGGPGAGTGPGNGAGQGGGSGPNQGQGFNPGSGQGVGQSQNVNPTKCIAECETIGKNCISALIPETKDCLSKGQYCREVTCETVDADGNRSTAEVMHRCNDFQCTPQEKICNDAVTAKDSACRTTKDVCVMNCQKASKPTKPTQPTQPSQPNQPTPPTPPTAPAQPPIGNGGAGQSQNTNPNPVKCTEDCEYVGKICLGQAGDEGKVCASEGQYCRTVYCETYGVQGDNRPTQEQYHACNDNVCTPTEKRCNDAVTAKDSACRTTKDQCVTQCQKASKPAKPTQPSQPNQPTPPSPPTQPGQPGQPPQPPSLSSPPN